MKRLLIILAVVVSMGSFSPSYAFDLKSVLKGAASSAANDGSQGGLGDLIGTLGNILGKTDVTIGDLVGEWQYVKPAVAFKSDNLLKKAGGEVAATALENKMAPYYQKAGITAMKLKINADSTFTMTVKRASLSGTLVKDENGNFIFKFQALNQIKIGQMTSVITKSGVNNIDLTFDASKLIELVSKIATLSGNSTIKTVSSMLESYDGMNAGFQLSKAK